MCTEPWMSLPNDNLPFSNFHFLDHPSSKVAPIPGLACPIWGDLPGTWCSSMSGICNNSYRDCMKTYGTYYILLTWWCPWIIPDAAYVGVFCILGCYYRTQWYIQCRQKTLSWTVQFSPRPMVQSLQSCDAGNPNNWWSFGMVLDVKKQEYFSKQWSLILALLASLVQFM